MEIQTAPVKKIAYLYGPLLALVSIISTVIMYVWQLEKNLYLSTIGVILTITIVVYGVINFKKENGNYVSIKESLKAGLAIAVIGGFLSAIYTFIHYSYIQPEFIDNLYNDSMTEATKSQPNMDKDTKEMIEKMTKFLTSPFILSTFSLIGTLFFGFIISLITGAIIKKDRP